ncbi:Helix-turn-helix domain-containing protein [Lentzea xinjiangensis]|uniref:Helix-turn-helix domain-containing protein n=2 Tax=Lentzea xinjiangensis TaxID=402600 RepID=A0A1H9D9T3_9PSEU|nr:Helix-turn-helix domain-containing protein [Lentzea xinjiangensis]
MDWTSSTPYSRDLGDELRHLRQSCTDHTGAGLAEVLGWDPSKISTIEQGKVRATESDLVQYLTACGQNLGFISEFISRYRRAFDVCFAQSADQTRTLLLAERMASSITVYSPTNVPDLLQTASYAEQSLLSSGASPDEIQSTVDSILERQKTLYAHNAPLPTFYLTEKALDPRTHDRNVLRGQVTHLLRMARVVRLIPTGGKFPLVDDCTLIEYGNMPTVVFTGTHVAKIFVQEKPAVARCRSLFQKLDRTSVSPEQSIALLIDLHDTLGSGQ